MQLIAAFVALLFVYSLVSGRLERGFVTAPMVFTTAGVAALHFLSEGQMHRGGHAPFLVVAEVGLVLLLFTDASRTDLAVLRSIRSLPMRLLSIGMLLTIGLGAVVARLLFPQLTWAEAGILAAILAPTDAGLGQVIVNSPRVPLKIREALNVEAGLNDGLSVPFLLFFIALAGGGEGEGARLGQFIAEQLGLGVAVGLAIGLAGGWLLGTARRRRWMKPAWQQPGVVALPLLCVVSAEEAGASMFIAAFVAGLAVQVGFPGISEHSVEFAEEWGQLFNLAVFFLFGMFVAGAWPELRWPHAAYAILSLTVVRMAPVAIALAGSRLHRATVLFMGWFGPRGLASIVLGMVYLEQMTRSDQPVIHLVVTATVLMSIFAHGCSAMPGTRLYARTLRSFAANAPELESPPSQGPAQPSR